MSFIGGKTFVSGTGEGWFKACLSFKSFSLIIVNFDGIFGLVFGVQNGDTVDHSMNIFLVGAFFTVMVRPGIIVRIMKKILML